MIVMKFGGTSVANFEAITRTISIVEGRLDQKPIVVVSALSKITDLLYQISDAAVAGNKTLTAELLDQLRQRHLNLACELLEADQDLKEKALERINQLCNGLDTSAYEVYEAGKLTDRHKAIIISNGELLSSTIICYAMNARGIRTNWVDARSMMITDDAYMKGAPIISELDARVPEIIGEAYNDVDAVITQGFIASNLKGEQTVLGRGGSDYSASLFGMAVDAERIEIWTDVDGVRSADPRAVQNTKYIEKISYEEAAQMAHFGAKVLHPLTIEPAIRKNIPLYVLNSMNPSGKVTAILRNELTEDGVKSVSFKENIRVISISSPSMVNTSAFLSRIFGIFSGNNVSVDLVIPSESNISVTVDASEKIEKSVEELSEFADVQVIDDKAQVSVIGKNIDRLNVILKKTFAPLKGCDLYVISQGVSFVNISFAVDREELRDIVQDLHDHLFDNIDELEGF